MMGYPMDMLRRLNRRSAILLLSVLVFLYFCSSFTSRVNFHLDEFKEKVPESSLAVTLRPSRHGIRKLDEGRFVLQASETFTAHRLVTTEEMHTFDEHMVKMGGIDVWKGTGTNRDKSLEVDGERRLPGISVTSNERLVNEDYHMNDGFMFDTQQQKQSLLTTPKEYQEIYDAKENKVLHNDLNSDRSLAERLLSERNLSSLLPRGGNTLPNYLLHGIDQGILPRTYREGILAFLHHNKAAGSSIKTCFSKMIKRNILKNHTRLVFSSKIISTFKTSEIMKYNAFAGGYSFWLCELYEGQNCSYFTIMRDPYDRVISSYYYCKVQYWDQLCGPLQVGNFTLEEWALYQGSYFFYQLLMQQRYCRTNGVIKDLFQNGEFDFIPQGTPKYIDYRETFQCWFKQRVYLSNVLEEADYEYLLNNVLDNLESWFSAVGLTEQFDLSLKMLSVTYGLPFYQRCRGKHVNRSPSYNGTKDSTKENEKAKLQADPKVRRALRFDIIIYQKGLEIFEAQKRRLQELLETDRNLANTR